jgi:hypothetical protein
LKTTELIDQNANVQRKLVDALGDIAKESK